MLVFVDIVQRMQSGLGRRRCDDPNDQDLKQDLRRCVEDLQRQAKSKTQEVEAWTRRHKQSRSCSSRDKEAVELELSHDLGSTQIDMKLDQSCRAFH